MSQRVLRSKFPAGISAAAPPSHIYTHTHTRCSKRRGGAAKGCRTKGKPPSKHQNIAPSQHLHELSPTQLCSQRQWLQLPLPPCQFNFTQGARRVTTHAMRAVGRVPRPRPPPPISFLFCCSCSARPPLRRAAGARPCPTLQVLQPLLIHVPHFSFDL